MAIRANVWGAAFALAVVVHITGLVLAGQGMLGDVVLEPKTEYLEVELAPVQSVPKMVHNQAGTTMPVNPRGQVVNPVGTSRVSATNPSFAAVGNNNVAAPVSAAVPGSGQVAEISGGSSGITAGTGEMGNSGVGSSGGGSGVAVPTQPSEEQEVDRRPYAVYSPSPEYPSEARRNKCQGRVIVRVLIEASGGVADAVLAKSSGYDELDEAAVEVLYRWRFNPAYRDGQPVAAWVKVPVSFKLTR